MFTHTERVRGMRTTVCAILVAALSPALPAAAGPPPLVRPAAPATVVRPGIAPAQAVPQAAVTSFRVVHAFNGNDGAQPQGALLQDLAGRLYGTTQTGGAANAGTVYSATPAGAVSTLHAFAGMPDGAAPQSGLFNLFGNFDLAGGLYGVTTAGGSSDNGTVFRVNAGGTTQVLHSFSGADGAAPNGELVRFTDGNYYGTTTAGGFNGNGVVFRISPSGTFTVLHGFTGADGANPYAGLAVSINGTAVDGRLYGTTVNGGAYGGGTIFAISPNGSFTTIYSFNPKTTGNAPAAKLVTDFHGRLLGTASSGGPGGAGTVFCTGTNGSLALIKTFSVNLLGQSPQGATPLGALAYNPLTRAIYGTTNAGGSMGAGTVFKIASGTLTFTILHQFSGLVDGQGPAGQILLSPNGAAYGTTLAGGTFGFGVLFALPQ